MWAYFLVYSSLTARSAHGDSELFYVIMYLAICIVLHIIILIAFLYILKAFLDITHKCTTWTQIFLSHIYQI